MARKKSSGIPALGAGSRWFKSSRSDQPSLAAIASSYGSARQQASEGCRAEVARQRRRAHPLTTLGAFRA